MSNYYLTPSEMDAEEHLYWEPRKDPCAEKCEPPQPPSCKGNWKPRPVPVPSGRNDGLKQTIFVETNGDNSNKFRKRFYYVVLGVHTIVILALVGIAIHLLRMPNTDVFCPKDQPAEDCQTFEAVMTRLTTAETEVTYLKGTLAQKRETTSPPTETFTPQPVLFSAKSVETDNVIDGATIRFAIVTENIGRGYNRDDGVFTAPYSGSYLFHTSLCAKQDKWVYVNIMAKGVSLVTIGTRDEESNGVCSSASAMTFLRAGDTAWVQGIWNETGAIYAKVPYSTPVFCGTLLHASL